MAHTATADELKRAVHHHPAHSGAGALERLFTFAFSGLVYPQIWEDPEVDMAAMELGPDHRIITIASGGCNVLSYLARRPKSIVAVDLNPAHIALTRLTGRRLSLYGLGIPPEQYTKLAGDGCMADVLADRLRRLACDFPARENYFAWQAFARSYGPYDAPALPP